MLLLRSHQEDTRAHGVGWVLYGRDGTDGTTEKLRQLKPMSGCWWRIKVKMVTVFCRKPLSELRSVACHMGSYSVTCHSTQVNMTHLNPSQIGRYSIYLLFGDERLSWPRRLVTYRDGLPARRQSPIQVLTRPGVEQLRWSDTTRYRYATPPTQRSTTWKCWRVAVNSNTRYKPMLATYRRCTACFTERRFRLWRRSLK